MEIQVLSAYFVANLENSFYYRHYSSFVHYFPIHNPRYGSRVARSLVLLKLKKIHILLSGLFKLSIKPVMGLQNYLLVVIIIVRVYFQVYSGSWVYTFISGPQAHLRESLNPPEQKLPREFQRALAFSRLAPASELWLR